MFGCSDMMGFAGCGVILRRTTVDVMVRFAMGVMASRRPRARPERERNIVEVNWDLGWVEYRLCCWR